MKYIRQIVPFCALVALALLVPQSAYAVDPKVQTSTEPVIDGPNAGCEKITIKVDPNNTVVTDVHLWLGRRIRDAAPPKATRVTVIGDPGNFRQSDDPLPEDWKAAEKGTAKGNKDWAGPQLAGETSFSVLYCGTQKLEKQTPGDKDKKGKKAIKITTKGDKVFFVELGFSTYGKDGGFDE